jgi:hypothetical protein
MALSVTQIILYSKNPQGIATFLSEILETEMRRSQEGIYVDYSSLGFLILENPEKSLPRGNMQVNFLAESENELDDLIQRIEFYRYRNAPKQKVPILEREGDLSYFILNDTDGRNWKFSYLHK